MAMFYLTALATAISSDALAVMIAGDDRRGIITCLILTMFFFVAMIAIKAFCI